MKPVQIEERHLALIRNIVDQTCGPGKVKAYVFGSRSTNSAAMYSDVDIAVDYCGAKLPKELYVQLCFAFENSMLPYKADVVDLADVSPSFYGNIKESLVRFL